MASCTFSSPSSSSYAEPQSSLPAPIDISHHFSEPTKRRVASEVKRFYKYFQIPGIGQLAGGLPFHGYFPFDTLEASAALPSRWKPTPNEPVEPPVLSQHSAVPEASTISPENPKAAQIVVPKETDEQNLVRKIDVATALQYGQANGYAPLEAWVRAFTQKHLHPRTPYAGGVEVILSCGNTDGMSKSIEALSNIWVEGRHPVADREGILCEEFSFMGGVSIAAAHGLNIVPVKVDKQGMTASGKGGLEDVLANWDSSKGKRPHLIYTIGIGQNPTGGVLGMERRKAIYEVCVKYDVIIIEDEPYWYLQYPSASKGAMHVPDKDTPSSGYPFLDSLVPSYISIDRQGRVVRLDTFSKTVAPGCRLGWITAQPVLIERIMRITETSTAQPSGFVQSLIAELVMGPGSSKHSKPAAGQQDGWDVSGWVRWLEGLRGNYERRMTAMCDILDSGTHMIKSGRRPSLSQLAISSSPSSSSSPTTNTSSLEDDWGVIERVPMYRFHRPRAGMFVWAEVLYATHPLAAHFSLADLSTALWVHLTTAPFRVLVAPGVIFGATPQIKASYAAAYFRFSFCAGEDDMIRRAARGFVDGVAAFWRIKDKAEVRRLLDDARETGGEVEALAGPYFC